MSKSSAEHFQERYGCDPAEATQEQRVEEWRRLKGVQVEKGFKPGWVGFAFKDLFGEWPPRGGFPDEGAEPKSEPRQVSQQDDPYGPPGDSPPAQQNQFDYGPPVMSDDPEPQMHCPHCGAML